ncbi:DegV family protein [Hominiventricola filiformis]|uniref:DegV family protein n=1 Tax=Hominiventricola filiformis TaxID=2885352 RepID=A0AAE3A956_9FIRM|nr:DegV family protein [Hominiventricola filiformis]MCC2126732.1 DegV family protein [Hominiventricola filiformis]RHU83430.1 DegV family protein [Clostridiaceae bacterium OM08-6BH]
MSYRIVVDSCGEFTEEMAKDSHFVHAALNLEIDGNHFVDDETFDRLRFLDLVEKSPNCPKSSCPSPEVYRSAFDCGADHLYAVTLSAELSGSYNSAVLGQNLYLEDHPDAKIHVFNSCSASVGETLLAKKIQECEEAGMEFEEVIKAVEAYQAERQTFFVLESLDHLRKNGRLSAVKAFVASALNIKPVMEGNKQGIIEQAGQARGMQKALRMMVELLVERMNKPEEKTVAIVHCNNEARAQFVKEEIEKRTKVKEIIILPSSGVSTLYAAQGGIILVG